MKTSVLSYDVPRRLFAWGPLPVRLRARMLVVDRATGKMVNSHCSELPRYAAELGLPVWANNSKLRRGVLEVWSPSGRRKGEDKTFPKILCLEQHDDEGLEWTCILYGPSSEPLQHPEGWLLRDGTELCFVEELPRSRWRVRFDRPPDFYGIGTIPAPTKPVQGIGANREEWYEPLYAKRIGGTAVPTAGVDLDQACIEALDLKYLTLYPAPDNARMISTPEVESYGRFLQSEQYGFWDDEPPTSPVLALGSTVVKALETYARTGEPEGRSDLYVCPGLELRLTGALLTNLHFPRDPILALTCAVGGVDLTMEAHRFAVREHYRFGGYGDLLLIL